MAKKTCPSCNGKNIAKILYGLYDVRDFEELEQNKIVLGGCCVTGHDPKWECNNCGFRWR